MLDVALTLFCLIISAPLLFVALVVFFAGRPE